jgi:AbrB family looped-hinge helix DNA binding protein
MPTSILTKKGQITIPQEIRTHLKLQAGDKIEFTIRPNRTVMMTARNVDIRELAGMLAPAPRHLTIAQMDDAIRSRFRRRFRQP